MAWTPETGSGPRPYGAEGLALTGTAAAAAEAAFPALRRTRAFSMRMYARVSPQPVWVRPSVSEMLLQGWGQYLSVLIPVFFAVWWLTSLVFDAGVLDAGSEADRVVR